MSADEVEARVARHHMDALRAVRRRIPEGDRAALSAPEASVPVSELPKDLYDACQRLATESVSATATASSRMDAMFGVIDAFGRYKRARAEEQARGQ